MNAKAKRPPPQFGPAMLALPSDRWRAAAVARFMVPVRGRWSGNAAACRAAGFASTKPEALKVTAHRLFHDERMLAALRELGEYYLRTGVSDALSVIDEIMRDTKHKDRLKAAQVVINYSHPIQTTHHVTVEHVDDRRMLEFALKLAEEMGVEAGKLIGRVDGKLIEHDAGEVSSSPDDSRTESPS
jgi:uncharacterized protein (DUF2164 family)